MKNWREILNPLLHKDHHYMALAAMERLPSKSQDIFEAEAPLFIRFFGELPDYNYAVFNYPGYFDVSNKYQLDLRRNFRASYFLMNNPIVSVRGGLPHNISNGDEFVFNGENDFIEIAYMPRWTPIWCEDNLVLSINIFPEEILKGEIAMSAKQVAKPFSCWKVYFKDGSMGITMFTDDEKFDYLFKNLPVCKDKWSEFKITIGEKFAKCAVDGKSESCKFPFKRTYADCGHFFGSDFGVENFFKGRMKNIRIDNEQA
ncbi:MAG: hypothetical protein L3J71_04860 [Victivallaceae bacterium]|nr:hypothetical protein [Victivallaceae bacterium]